MDYNGLIERLKFPIWQDIEEPDSTLLLEAATTITDLLVRAEAAEARCRLAEKCFDDSALHACETQLELEKKARAEAEARAEKAERERDAAVADLRLVSDCRTCGNVSPWCIDNPDKCKGWEWRGRKEE